MAGNKKNAALFKKYLGKMDSLKKEKKASEIFASLSAGKNSYMRIDRLENSNFDFSWIKEIEDCIYDLGEIIANPREVTKTVTNIVPVELARKTNAESVQHLASHTQYIKEVKEDGDVVPNKILNIGSEEDIHTYENRFIATLVRRLVLFIQKRYEFVRNFSILHDEEILYYKTKSIVDGADVEIETKIKVKSPSDTKAADMSNKAVERILKIREYVLYFYGSKFMKELKTERDVRNPIVMTNILRKNPKYNHCYRLYKFIEKYLLMYLLLKPISKGTIMLILKPLFSLFFSSDVKQLSFPFNLSVNALSFLKLYSLKYSLLISLIYKLSF